MVALQDYQGREQAYVKHLFLERYLERLVHKTASAYDHVVYVDGFAGPWQSANEQFQDTSFGIALNALRQAKWTWQGAGRIVKMSAYLVEKDALAYSRLAEAAARFPDIRIRTYNDGFVNAISEVLDDIPKDAFSFFFIDPKGWRFRLYDLAKMLRRRNSEVIFNFMFDFINRAASIKDPVVQQGVDALIPHGSWRKQLEEAERNGATPEDRKNIIVSGFRESLATIGSYEYVAETTVLRPLRDRPLYCLCYATRHPKGIEVFRDCQIKALQDQALTRAVAKIKHSERTTGQWEIFESIHEMAPNDLTEKFAAERKAAEKTFLELTPYAPEFTKYELVWPLVLAKHVDRLPDVNQIAAQLRKEQRIVFPDWEPGKRVPQPGYKLQKP